MQARSASGESLPCEMATFPPCPQVAVRRGEGGKTDLGDRRWGGEERKERARASVTGPLGPPLEGQGSNLIRASPSRPHIILVTPYRPFIQMQSHWGLGPEYMNFRRVQFNP